MAKFLTIGYGDQAGYDRTAEALRQTAHHHDAWLKQRGALIGVAGTPVQVRNPDGAGVIKQDGPFMYSGLPIAGFALIEATDLAQAIDLVSRTPCSIAQGVVEVWPLLE